MVFTQIFCGIKQWSVIFACFLFISCNSYRTISVDVLKPAKITIRPEERIGFLNRDIHWTSDTAFFLNLVPGLNPDALALLFYHGLNNVLTGEEGKHDTLLMMGSKNPTYLEDKMLLPSLDVADVQKICSVFNIDHIISLEEHRYLLEKNERRVGNKYHICLYSLNKPGVVDSVVYREDITEILSDEYDYAGYITTDAFQKGIDYAYRLVPHWAGAERRVYNKGKILGVGDVFFREGDIDQTLQLWTAATRMNIKIAVKAYINLAWMYENSEEFEIAAGYLREGIKLSKDKNLQNAEVVYLEEYLKEIEQRIADIHLLDEQMN